MEKIILKQKFEERMKLLLGNEFGEFMESLEKEPLVSIRANELKISVSELKKRLEEKGWKISQPVKEHPEIFVIASQLAPGELGRTLEHLLGYYYVQEISSMLPAIVLNPRPGERVLDLCASPGSKTTQIASMMKNKGTVIANEPDFRRMKILSSNLERCGVSNSIITRKEGSRLCDELHENGFVFDKILIDAPCSGEGTLRTNPKTMKMWNANGMKKMSFIQKRLLSSAIKLLRIGGEIVYSTCTFAPEEDEEVVDFMLERFPEIKVEKILIPIDHHPGILKWQNKEYDEELKHSCRIFPFDNNTEGFFITKLRKVK
ncbi:MAG: RsmB/NOP family class I SAM-dependent RNA methyltransferase [Candidatus Pacearchaeota archaeon]|nr:RsmB/NOP family class I SAM-dependent RNA methyltransferase [Candidatus Pacearchaeota archaeon]MDE1848826.1 RsmB/NOP family class I SAM-dependent RNA methyltransferase [Nanoarchaeota archaeon]